MKQCSLCKETKRISEFSRHSGMKDGHQVWCKSCLGPRNKKWARDNSERKRELSRVWRAKNIDRVRELGRVRYVANRDKINATKRAWYAKSRAVVREINRRRNLRRYGLTESDYKRILAKQNGGCAICSAGPKKRRLSVDHCHNSETVRGLLCDGCNFGIGLFNDSPDRLRAAAKYLETFERSAEE